MIADRILRPNLTGVAKQGDGDLIFNKEIVQMLIDWMDGEIKTYGECIEFLDGIFVSRRMLFADPEHVFNCLDRLDAFWRMDETQH